MPVRKTTFQVFVVSILLVFGLKPAVSEENYPPVAVVELFTSEGCSSCPPADRLLSDLTRTSRSTEPQIFTLGFHVDYWNDLGWPDRFSSPEFTNRQRVYAKTRGTYQVYTPQMVINGIDEFGGYRKDMAEKSIKKFLLEPAAAQIQLALKTSAPEKTLEIEFDLDGSWETAILNLALVERELVNQVSRGENKGKALKHENVVRTFESVSVQQRKGKIQLTIPEGLVVSNASVIAYLQDPKTLKVIGASRQDLVTKK